MNEDKSISKIKDFAIKNSEKNDIHGFDHVKRVFNLCIVIGEKLNCDLEILKIAALLHDIGRIHEKNEGRNHAEISADKAKQFLTSGKFNLTQNDIERITHCIQAHSFSNEITPKTLEAKILSDADKLDALGAIGLYRTIGFTILRNGDLEDVIEHLENKILVLKDLLYIEESKRIAEQRQKIILNFYNKIKEQL
jgi:uncharacterized protein